MCFNLIKVWKIRYIFVVIILLTVTWFYKVEENRHYRVHQPQEIVKSSAFKNSRSVFLRHTMSKGRYILVASTFKPGLSANFMLRLYTLNANKAK